MIHNTSAPSHRADTPEAFAARGEVRAGMDALAASQRLPKGTVLFRQGESPRGVWVLHRGRVRLTMRNDAGKVVPYRTVRAGYVLGLPAVILDVPYLFTAELMERSETAFIERGQMLQFLRQRADLCFDVVQQLGGELIDLKIVPTPAVRRKPLRSNA